VDEPVDPLRAFRLLAKSDLAAPAPELGNPLRRGLEPGALLDGRFRIDELLAEGGMGGVYRAWDGELERAVAVKVQLVHGDQAEVRFQREAELTARLRHPHVLQVHGSGTVGSQSYIVYELIEGAQTLEDALGARDLEGRLDLLEQAAAGVAAAHAAGIVHRDLKPPNVLVRPDGSAVVADFGVAHVDASSLTTSGQLLGTPAYMAPEQVSGEPTTPAADVWALGVLLYEVLYGRHPFAEALALPALMERIHRVQVEFPAGPPPDLVAFLRRLVLVRDPGARLPDAGAFLERLRAVRGDLGAGRVRSGRGVGLAGGLALVLVLVLGVGFALSVLGGAREVPQGEPDPPPATESPASEPPPDAPTETARARWDLPPELGDPHASAWFGEQLLVVFRDVTVLWSDAGEELARVSRRLYPIQETSAWGEVLWGHDEQRTYRLERGTLELREVLPRVADCCDPAVGNLVACVDGEARVFDGNGRLLRSCRLPDGAQAKQAFLLGDLVVVAANAPAPRLFLCPAGESIARRVEGPLSPGRLDVWASPGTRTLALSGQSGFVWLYPEADVTRAPQQLSREREGADLLGSVTTAHLGGVRGVLFWGERVLSWGRGNLESELVVWTPEGEIESVHSTVGLRALALRPDGALAWVREGEVEVAPIGDLLGD